MKMAFLSRVESRLCVCIYGQVQDTRRPFALAFSLMTTNRDGLDVLYYTIRLICQTLVYGEPLNEELRKMSLIHTTRTRHVHDTHAPLLLCNVVCPLTPVGTRYSRDEQQEKRPSRNNPTTAFLHADLHVLSLDSPLGSIRIP